jgi:stage V sporulation protein SpoVS
MSHGVAPGFNPAAVAGAILTALREYVKSEGLDMDSLPSMPSIDIQSYTEKGK